MSLCCAMAVKRFREAVPSPGRAKHGTWPAFAATMHEVGDRHATKPHRAAARQGPSQRRYFLASGPRWRVDREAVSHRRRGVAVEDPARAVDAAARAPHVRGTADRGGGGQRPRPWVRARAPESLSVARWSL